MPELKVGMVVKLIRTQQSKDATWSRCGGRNEPEMFTTGLKVITKVYPEYIELSDGYNYVADSVQVVKKKVPIYRGTIADREAMGVDGLLLVGCTQVRITKKLLKDLSKIAKG